MSDFETVRRQHYEEYDHYAGVRCVICEGLDRIEARESKLREALEEIEDRSSWPADGADANLRRVTERARQALADTTEEGVK